MKKTIEALREVVALVKDVIPLWTWFTTTQFYEDFQTRQEKRTETAAWLRQYIPQPLKDFFRSVNACSLIIIGIWYSLLGTLIFLQALLLGVVGPNKASVLILGYFLFSCFFGRICFLDGVDELKQSLLKST